MMIFGRSLFGGATSGQILAVGFASALVSAVAVPEVTRLAHINAQAGAATHTNATRVREPSARLASAKGQATGAALSQLNGYGTAASAAYGFGKGTADFYLEGDAYAQFIYKAIASKRTRAPRALAWTSATGRAEGQVYEYVYGKTAVAKASALGTTYHIGRTDGRPKATGQAVVSVIAGARSQAQASSDAVGECRRAGGAAAQVKGIAHPLVDGAVTRNNIREFELVGIGACTAAAEIANVSVYQIQKTRSYAYGSKPIPAITRGVKGAAKSAASARGMALGTSTAASPKTGDSKTVAQAKASYRLGGKVLAKAISSLTGRVVATFQRSGSAQAKAVLAATSLTLEIRGQAASTTGSGAAQATRTAAASSALTAHAQASGFMQVNDLSKAPIDRTVLVENEDRLVSVEDQPRLILI